MITGLGPDQANANEVKREQRTILNIALARAHASGQSERARNLRTHSRLNAEERARAALSTAGRPPRNWRIGMGNLLKNAVNPSNWFRNPIARDTGGMRMSPVAKVLEPASSFNELAPRFIALNRLAEAIRSHTDEKDLFGTLVNELREVVEFDVLCQFDGTANWVQWYFVEPYKGKLEARRLEDVPREETAAWWVYENQEPVLVRVADQETRFSQMVDRLAKLGLNSAYVLPLSTAHRKLGSLAFTSRLEHAYSLDEQRFLSLVANQIAVAIDDARAQKRLKLLLDLTNRVVSKLQLPALLQEVSASIRHVMQCESVGVSLPDAEAGELRRYAFDFPGHDEILARTCTDRETAVFRTCEPVNLTRDEIAAFPGATGVIHSCSLLPLLSGGRAVGVLILGSSRESAFTQEDLAFLGQVANQIALAVENAVAYGEISQLKDRLVLENVYLESEIRNELHFEDIVGNSQALKRVLREIEIVAPADSTVLIYGETGTGKELIARAVHNLSSRKSNTFVKLNCAAIPTGLLESELFGHEKGAFTGAISQRVGRFELAHRGTIFLDEVGEIPLELQPKLLRVLQEREFERLGSTRTLRTDARLIAATNRDLKGMVEEQKFRSDLYYRLNVFPIRVPALRERREDIPLLVRHFVQQFSQRNNRVFNSIPSETMEALVHYHWPGNIRELQNVIERAVIISKGPVLNVALRELERVATPRARQAEAKATQPEQENLDAFLNETERTQILRALEASNGVIGGPSGAAARLGMKRSTLQLRMQRLGIRLSPVSRTALTESKGTVG
jgi:formate hydrogenlyase transcriptional activator